MIKLLSSFCNLWLAPTISQRIPKTLLIDLNLVYTKVQDFVTTSTQLHTQEDPLLLVPRVLHVAVTQQQCLQQFNNYCNKSNNSEKLIYFQVHYSKTSVLAQCLRQ
ncbi:hypothetical protein BYT27DRAFT_7201694 [Phlegmacium glaucopus]|nr:hypothetical protein BYT27DRAFT_7201694 [Phlegmacium glaucopus]